MLTNISSLHLAVPDMHNDKVEKDILLCKQNPPLSCISLKLFNSCIGMMFCRIDQELSDCFIRVITLAEILSLFSENKFNPNYTSE